MKRLTDGEREQINRENSDGYADARAEWESLTEDQRDAALQAEWKSYGISDWRDLR